MFKKLFAAIFILSIVLLQFGATYAEGVNQLLNPGFEESNMDIAFWENKIYNSSPGAGEITLETSGAHSGNNCIKIVNSIANDSRIAQVVSVKPSTLYKISGWIKTENVSDTGRGAILSIYMMMVSTTELKGTNDWTYVEMYGRTGSNQQSLEFTAGLGGHGGESTGTAYFDDISVEETSNVPEGASIENLFDPSQNNQSSNTDGASGKNWIVFLIAALIVAIGVVVFFVFKMSGKEDNKNKLDIEDEKKNDKNGKNVKTAFNGISEGVPFKIDKKDMLIMVAMTVIYSAIALFNLGGTNVPETFWKPSVLGTTFSVNFDREYDLSKIAYYHGINDLSIRVEYLKPDGEYEPLTTINQGVYQAFMWASSDVPVKTKTLRFKVQKVSGTLNEIVFFESGSKEPIKNFTVQAEKTGENDIGTVDNLFDELSVGDYENDFMNSTYFDEIYFARTAFEHINRMEPYETTHPPLGKLIMAIGMLIFGVNPFGWRVMGTLFGAAMVPVMYLFGKKIFGKRIYGFISAFLIMFECMHFAQTRIATIDSYAGLFVILAYYFMYDYFINKSYEVGFKKSMIPLMLAGISWALGSASKWTAVYAGGGLAVLYFSSRYLEYNGYNKLLRKKALSSSARKSKINAWIKDHLVLTSLACVLFFVIIPVILYSASYLPIITLPGDHHNLDEIRRYQVNMFNYHSQLTDDHTWASPAYSWPLIKKPLLEYRNMNLPSSVTSIMYVMGNPAVFWFGIVCVFLALLISIYKKDKRAVPFLVAFAFQYLPWFRVSRCIFIYHFFTSVPFLILSIVYVLNFLKEDLPKIIGKDFGSRSSEITARNISTAFIYSYLVLTLVLFIFFYPVISGMEIPTEYLKFYRWINIL